MLTGMWLSCLEALKKSENRLQYTQVAITKTRLFKYIENFTSKNWKSSDKKTQISDQNIDCGFSLEPPRQGGSND